MRQSRLPGRPRGGYTLIELLVVNIMMALLVVLIGGAWRAFAPLSIEVIARGRIVNEANIAAQALYQDASSGPLGLATTQITQVDGTTLQFDYGTPVVGIYPAVVNYSFIATPGEVMSSSGQPVNSTGRLDRTVVEGGVTSTVTIARNVESAVALTLQPVGSSETSRVQYTLTFAYRGFRGQYTFMMHQ